MPRFLERADELKVEVRELEHKVKKMEDEMEEHSRGKGEEVALVEKLQIQVTPQYI